jgi:hypothetical protein
VIHFGLEDVPRVHVVASCDVDAARLAAWIDRSRVLDRLPDLAAEAVEQLRGGGENEAA